MSDKYVEGDSKLITYVDVRKGKLSCTAYCTHNFIHNTLKINRISACDTSGTLPFMDDLMELLFDSKKDVRVAIKKRLTESLANNDLLLTSVTVKVPKEASVLIRKYARDLMLSHYFKVLENHISDLATILQNKKFIKAVNVTQREETKVFYCDCVIDDDFGIIDPEEFHRMYLPEEYMVVMLGDLLETDVIWKEEE
jgi:hypothetical protein